jgi:hypothetical protein
METSKILTRLESLIGKCITALEISIFGESEIEKLPMIKVFRKNERDSTFGRYVLSEENSNGKEHYEIFLDNLEKEIGRLSKIYHVNLQLPERAFELDAFGIGIAAYLVRYKVQHRLKVPLFSEEDMTRVGDLDLKHAIELAKKFLKEYPPEGKNIKKEFDARVVQFFAIKKWLIARNTPDFNVLRYLHNQIIHIIVGEPRKYYGGLEALYFLNVSTSKLDLNRPKSPKWFLTIL